MGTFSRYNGNGVWFVDEVAIARAAGIGLPRRTLRARLLSTSGLVHPELI